MACSRSHAWTRNLTQRKYRYRLPANHREEGSTTQSSLGDRLLLQSYPCRSQHHPIAPTGVLHGLGLIPTKTTVLRGHLGVRHPIPYVASIFERLRSAISQFWPPK